MRVSARKDPRCWGSGRYAARNCKGEGEKGRGGGERSERGGTDEEQPLSVLANCETEWRAPPSLAHGASSGTASTNGIHLEESEEKSCGNSIACTLDPTLRSCLKRVLSGVGRV